MNKDAFYFSHDSNARNDQRLLKVRMKYGIEGYGVYFGIIEILREQTSYYLYTSEFHSIAYDLRVTEDIVKDIILNYDLFEIDGDLFHSRSLTSRMEKMDIIRKKRSQAGKKSGKVRSVDKQNVNISSTNVQQRKEKKGKENKRKDIKDRYVEFETELQIYINQYDFKLLEDFYNYWTEPNKSNTKLKFEMEKTWDTTKRLKRWADNDYGNNKSNGIKKKLNFKMPDGKNYIAYCDKCGKSDFYEPFNFNPDIIESKCCNSIILNERKKYDKESN